MSNKKLDTLDRILDGCTSFCAPWRMSKNMAEAMGYEWKKLTKEQKDPVIMFQWSLKGKGFGEFSFYSKNGKIYCDNECEDKEFIKMMLCKMVDDCILKTKW